MTDAVDTLLHEWAIPRMNVRHVMVAIFVGNEGSIKVFSRNGFKMLNTIENHKEVRGKMRGLHVMEWYGNRDRPAHFLRYIPRFLSFVYIQPCKDPRHMTFPIFDFPILIF